MSADSLVERFKKQQVEAGEFNHLAHLKVAWSYIHEYSPVEARERFHSDIIKLTQVLGAEEKYHRTLTDFFIDYLYQIKWYLSSKLAADKSWSLVEKQCPLLINDAKKLVPLKQSRTTSKPIKCPWIELVCVFRRKTFQYLM